MSQLIKRPKTAQQAREEYIAAMWLAFCRAPRKAQPDDDGKFSLGEIGEVKLEGQRIDRWNPYATAKGLR